MIKFSESALPIRPTTLLGVLVGCGLVTMFLLPSDRQLLERQLRDGYTDRALQTLRRLSGKERSKRPGYYAVLELRLRRQTADAEAADEINALTVAACRAFEQFDYPADFLSEILALIALGQSANATHELLEPYLLQMPLAARERVYAALVSQALACADPHTAARLTMSYESNAPPSEVTVTNLVRLWRFAERPDFALAAVDRFAAQMRKPLPEVSPLLARVRIDLLREVGEPSKAFEATRDLAAAGNPTARDQLFDLLVTTARESSRAKEIVPDLQRQVAAQPENPKLWPLLGEAALAARNPALAIEAYQKHSALQPDASSLLLDLARLCEGNNRPQMAFDYYLKLLPKSEPIAIDRLLALNPGLYRDGELVEALMAVTEFVFQNNHGLELARLEASVGRFEAALRNYDRLVRERRRDFELLVEYGELLMNLFRYDEALLVFTQAEQLRPSDLKVGKAIAECLFRKDDYAAALVRYRGLADQKPGAVSLEYYITLASSLGRLEDIIHGLNRKLESSADGNRYDYVRLVDAYSLKGEDDQVLKVALAGLKLFPDDNNLRQHGVDVLRKRNNHAEAARLLSGHPGVKTDPEVAESYLHVLVDAKDYRQAESFLASGVGQSILLTPGVMEIRAYLHEVNDRPQEAKVLYAELYERDQQSVQYAMNYARVLCRLRQPREAEKVLAPFLSQPSLEMLRLAAVVYADGGDYAKAETYYRRSLEASGNAGAPDWRFLGDILAARGDKTKADEAYRQALREVLKGVGQ
jgi:tetratricopeptide (TPR) repeat protein